MGETSSSDTRGRTRGAGPGDRRVWIVWRGCVNQAGKRQRGTKTVWNPSGRVPERPAAGRRANLAALTQQAGRPSAGLPINVCARNSSYAKRPAITGDQVASELRDLKRHAAALMQAAARPYVMPTVPRENLCRAGQTRLDHNTNAPYTACSRIRLLRKFVGSVACFFLEKEKIRV